MSYQRFLVILGLGMVLLAACGGESTAAPVSAPTAVPTNTPAATTVPATPTASPANTPTATPSPTATPTATQAPLTPPPSTPPPTATSTTAPTMTTATATPTATSEPPPGGDAGSTVSLNPSKDNTLYESDTGSSSNGAGAYLFVGKTNSGSIRRAVIAFDIAGQIPTGSTIKSVTLTLHMSRTQAGAETSEVHRLLADWGEGISDAIGTEGGGTTSTSGDATWIHRFFETDAWQTPGGDFSTTASASTSVSGTGNYTWGSTAQLVADVQAWLDDPSSNFGWILLGNEDDNQTAKRFDSKENSAAANRPVLAVSFTVAESDSGGTTNPPEATQTSSDSDSEDSDDDIYS